MKKLVKSLLSALRLAQLLKSSIGTKLLLSHILIAVVTGLVFAGVGIYYIHNRVVEQALEMVGNNLNSAREIYHNEMQRVSHCVRFLAESFYLKDAIISGNIRQIKKIFQKNLEREGLDFLTLTDERGKVVLRARNPEIFGDDLSKDVLIQAVLKNGEPVVSTEIMPAEELKKEGEDLAHRAYVKFIPTPMARERRETEETSGMVLKAVFPVRDYEGRLIGVVYGGILLNRNYPIVDKIKETVFQNVKYKGKDIGTATIFQDDVRITTNVMNQDGTRAIATRAAADVYEKVVRQGQTFIGRAFVVNNWYITAYEPIRDFQGKIIGMLYVGILEEKYVDIRRNTILAVLGITCSGLVVSLILSYLVFRSLMVPIRKLVLNARRLAGGDLQVRVNVNSHGELRELAETLNQMANALQKREEELKEYTRKKIMESERLAIIGQLSAGIAHELNNPLQGILAYSHLMLEKLPPDEPKREYCEKIAKQATRCREIVKGLLDFSRQIQPQKRPCSINTILKDTLFLLQDQALFHNVKIVKNLDESLPPVVCDPGQIQQVFMNILINAAEAMDGVGTLTLATRMAPYGNFVEIEFTDTGKGIPEEYIEKIFDPFFTTKESRKGTGLGLAISHGIIKKHNGTIEVKSTVGVGTTFIVSLPIQEVSQ
ncbi:MAG: cache domain-containing protein [bacterium JZ-2024 1]